MKVLEAATQIKARPDIVYGVLTDFGAYGEWCGMFKSMTGVPEVGQSFSAAVEAKNGKTNTVSAKVSVAAPPHKFAWTGGLPIPGLFRAEHSFDMTAADGGTAFSHREEFRGLLTVLLTKKALSEAETQFNAFCDDLKARAEELAARA